MLINKGYNVYNIFFIKPVKLSMNVRQGYQKITHIIYIYIVHGYSIRPFILGEIRLLESTELALYSLCPK